MPDLEPRVDLLERLQAQQEVLNDQLITVTARLGEEHALYQERLAQHAEQMAALHALQDRQERVLVTLAAIASQHEARMTELQALLAAIRDMLDRGNGH